MSSRLAYRWFACLAASLFWAVQANAQAPDLSKDPRLQSAISLKLKIVAVGDALTQIGKLAGISLDRSLAIKDLKLTVLVHEVPVGELLVKISKTLGCEWKQDGQTYRLVMNPDEQSVRTRYMEAEDSAGQKEVADELDVITKISRMDPDAARKELLELEAAKDAPASSKSKFDPQREELLKRAINKQDVMLGRFLTSMSADKVSAFWRGDLIAVSPNQIGEHLDSQPPGNTSPTPMPRNMRFAPGMSPTSIPLFVQYDPLLFRVQVFQGVGVRYVSKRSGKLITAPYPSGSMASMPFGKEILAWDMPVPTDGELTKLTVQASKAKSQFSNRLYSLADFLEKAFDQTQIPIVADAFRVPMFDKDFDSGVGALTDWLSMLKKNNHLTTRFENGFIMVRHGGFWRLRKFEAPEEQVSGLEAKVSKTGPTLLDYAMFISKLTPEQAKPFCLKDGSIAKFDTRPIELGYPALKFYSSLDPAGIAKATEDGISFSQMSNLMRQDFVVAALEGVFYATPPSAFCTDLVRLANTGDGRRLGFIMRTDETQINGVAVPGQDLLFGANLSESTIYKLPVSSSGGTSGSGYRV